MARTRLWPFLPEFRGEQAEQRVVLCHAFEAGLGEGGGVVGEASGAEAGEDAEGEVEEADEQAGGETHGAGGWDAEVGEEPESVWTHVSGEAHGEGLQLGLGEAVEEEVGDDEIG